ncbi:MAG: CHY zinc finger protein [Fimbriimonas sp.]|nr:CHY zinc finger protein [Fimbriimonas sp.]
MTRVVWGITVKGLDIDTITRCRHYASELDVICIRFACCDRFYPCFECHLEVADHAPVVWPRSRFHEKVILCGVCGALMTVDEYLESNDRCPHCSTGFNPGCDLHRHLYFEV